MKRFWSLLVIAILLFGTLSACGERQPIRIGLIAYLEGDALTIASSGQPGLNGAELAVDQINQNGGLRVAGVFYPVELVVEAVENNIEQSVEATHRLIEEKGVVAIVGPQYSGDAIAAGAVAEAASIPLVSGTSTNPQTTKNRRFVFRTAFVDTFQASALAQLAYNDLRVRRVAVLYDREDAYSSGLGLFFSASFANLGGEVVASETFVSGDWDMAQQFKRIMDVNPDLVFLPVYPAEAIYQAGSLRKLGFTGRLLGGDAWDALALVSLPAFEDAYASTAYSAVVKTPANQLFVADYLAAYNTPPIDAAGLVYDAFNLIFAAIQQEGSFTPTAIRDGLYSLPAYDGASGPIDFVDNGDPIKPINILKFERGELKFYKAIQPDQ
jgi:branched-chain amino acid transport system substrate-binding protein